jgi:hypothetical protein
MRPAFPDRVNAALTMPLRLAVFFVIQIASASCIPLTQTEVRGESEHFRAHIGPEGDLKVAWRHSSATPDKTKPAVNPKHCYAATEDGKRFPLRFRMSDSDEGYQFRTASVQLFDPATQRTLRWSNGLWRIHLEFLPPRNSFVIDTKIRNYTFMYAPVVHGPPN